MKVALYARVSTEDHGQDPENQMERLRKVAIARGCEIFKQYFDFKSGKDCNRPGLQDMLADAKLHSFDKVMVTRIDRMMRSTVNMLNILSSFEAWGIEFECIDQDIDTKTPSGRLVVTILSAVAQFDRELTSERVKEGMERARAKGIHIGRPSKELILANKKEELANRKAQQEIERLNMRLEQLRKQVPL